MRKLNKYLIKVYDFWSYMMVNRNLRFKIFDLLKQDLNLNLFWTIILITSNKMKSLTPISSTQTLKKSGSAFYIKKPPLP